MKTYLVALFAVIRAILYPGELVVCVSYTFKQGKDIVLKITDDFMHKSSLLRSEIEKVSTGQNDCGIWFKNGSSIVVKLANENTRGTRSTLIITDEARMVKQHIVDTVLRPMNVSRSPGYLNKPEYKHLREMPKEMYMSSAWYAQSEMMEKVKAYTANFLDEKYKYFICDLPYQLSIAEGLMLPQIIENEMSEATFSDISFMMEREGKFYGSGKDSLFNFKILNDRRILVANLYDLDYYRETGIKLPGKTLGEKRLLSVDVALLASRKHDNDASALIIASAIPTSSNNYMYNEQYMKTQEGLLTEELGLLTMRYYYQYECDYIGLDCSGIGQSILDYLMSDRYDPLYGCTYGALQCANNDDLNIRCKIKSAPKVIYAIKATAAMNNNMCLALRAGFQNGNINLLEIENDIEEKLEEIIKGYKKLPDNIQAKLKAPYLQTSFLVDELINLDHEVSNGLIKVREKSGMRKDRYSSLLYGYYVCQQLSLKLKPKNQSSSYSSVFKIRAPKKVRAF